MSSYNPSDVLSKKGLLKKKIVKRILYPTYEVLSFSFGRIYTCGPNSTNWLYSNLEGLLVLALNLKSKTCRFFLFDLKTFEILFECELYKKFNPNYIKDTERFYHFEIQKGFIGFEIPSIDEAGILNAVITNLTDDFIKKKIKEIKILNNDDLQKKGEKMLSLLKKKLNVNPPEKTNFPVIDKLAITQSDLEYSIKTMGFDDTCNKMNFVANGNFGLDKVVKKVKGISFNVQFSTKIADLDRYSNIVATNIMQTIKNGTYVPKAKVKRRKGRVIKNYSIVPIRYTEETLRQNEQEMKEKMENEMKKEESTGEENVNENKTNTNIPEPPKGSVPEPPKGSVPEPPKGSVPEPPKGSVPEPPKGSVPEPPKGSVPEPPKGSIPPPPTGNIPEPPKGNIPEPPKGNIPEPPKGNVPEPPKGNIPAPPKGNVPEPPKGNIPEPPKGNIPEPPKGNIPPPPKGNIPPPPKGNIPPPPTGNIPVPPPGNFPKPGEGSVPIPPPIPAITPVKPVDTNSSSSSSNQPLDLAAELALRKGGLKKVERKEYVPKALRKQGEEEDVPAGGGNDMRSQLLARMKGFGSSKKTSAAVPKDPPKKEEKPEIKPPSAPTQPSPPVTTPVSKPPSVPSPPVSAPPKPPSAPTNIPVPPPVPKAGTSGIPLPPPGGIPTPPPIPQAGANGIPLPPPGGIPTPPPIPQTGANGIPLPPPGGIPTPPPIPQAGANGVPLPPPGGIPMPPPMMNNAVKKPVKPAVQRDFKPKPKPLSMAEEIALRKSALKKVEIKEPKSAALRKPGEEPPSSSGGGNDMRSQLMNIFKAKKGFDFSKFDKK